MANIASPGVVIGAALATLLTVYFLKKRSKQRPTIPKRWRRVGTVGRVYCYPVKSCKGLSLETAECKKNGVHFANGRDRAFVVVDNDTNLVNSKTNPSMLLIEPVQEGNTLILRHPGLPEISVDLDDAVKKNVRSSVKLFKHVAPGIDLGNQVSSWLETAILGEAEPEKRERLSPLRLLYMAPDLGRTLPRHEETLPNFDPSHMVNYSGVTSYMIMGEGSMVDLNSRMAKSTDERPFRPSIFIDGSTPYEENEWQYLKINDAIFQASITCTRCPIVDIDVDKGVFREEKPSAVLKTYRKEQDPGTLKFKGTNAHGPVFGNYFQLCSEGNISVGDEVFAFP